MNESSVHADTANEQVTLVDLANEAGLYVATARIRIEDAGFSLDHVGNATPLSAGDVSLIRSYLTGRTDA
jgi:hypothetical protein